MGRPFCVQTTKHSDTVRIVMGETTNEQTSAGRPRDSRLDAAIIDATVEILTERGYNELSLAAVADQAETTTAAIYRRYGSKSELVAKAVFRTDGDDVVADTGDVAADLATMIGWSVVFSVNQNPNEKRALRNQVRPHD